MRNTTPAGRDRGVSSVVGITLILLLVMGGISVTIIIAEEEFSEASDQYQINQAELLMSSLDADASLVALGQSSIRQADLGATGHVTVKDDTGQLSIVLIHDNGNRTEITNTTLGSIQKQVGSSVIAYQGGGVWRQTNGRTQMASPPEFHYRDQTLTFPVITVSGTYSGSGSPLTLKSGGMAKLYPNKTLSNPVSGGVIRVEVTSSYHGGWAEYFRTRTQGAVDHNPSADRAAVNLTAPIGAIFGSSVTATSSDPGAISPSTCVSGGGGGGGGPPGGGPPGGGSPNIAELIAGGGSFTDSFVGVASATSLPSPGSGFECPTETGQQLPSASPNVEDKITACESGSCKDLSAELADGKLESGTYYHDGDFQFGPSESTLDTTNGNISIVIDGTVTFKGSGGPGTTDVEILGDQGVTYYVKDGLEASGNAAVNTGGDPSDLLVLVHSDATDAFSGGTPQFTGMLYAPNSNFSINGGGAVSNNVFGAVVAETATVNGNGYVEYDETLAPVMDLSFDPELTYLHVTKNRINVSGG